MKEDNSVMMTAGCCAARLHLNSCLEKASQTWYEIDNVRLGRNPLPPPLFHTLGTLAGTHWLEANSFRTHSPTAQRPL